MSIKESLQQIFAPIPKTVTWDPQEQTLEVSFAIDSMDPKVGRKGATHQLPHEDYVVIGPKRLQQLQLPIYASANKYLIPLFPQDARGVNSQLLKGLDDAVKKEKRKSFKPHHPINIVCESNQQRICLYIDTGRNEFHFQKVVTRINTLVESIEPRLQIQFLTALARFQNQ